MKTVLKSLTVALALGLALPVASLTCVDAPAQAQKLSPAVGNALNAARAASAKGQHAAAIQQIGVAKAAASGAENAAVARMAAYVYQNAGRYGDAARELESVGASARDLSALYLTAGNTAKALEYARKAGDSLLVAKIQFQQRNSKASAATIEGVINSAEKSGRPVPQDWLQLLMRNKYELKDQAGFTAALQKLVSRYPSPENWRDLLKRARNTPGMSDAGTFAVFRLMSATGSLATADLAEAARFAIINKVPGDAAKFLDEGFKANAFGADPNGSNARLMQRAKTDAATAAAGAAKAAAAAKTADQHAAAGRMFLSKGDYANAVASLNKAAAGKVADPDALFFDLGYANYKSGKKAEAVAAFRKVAARAGNKDVAGLWAIYARQ